jgi:hypothetical protein
LSATIRASSGLCTLSLIASRTGTSPFALLKGAGTDVGISSHLYPGLSVV